MPRSPLSKIAQGAHEVDVCPEKGCTYAIESYNHWVVHMWKVHKINMMDEEDE